MFLSLFCNHPKEYFRLVAVSAPSVYERPRERAKIKDQRLIPFCRSLIVSSYLATGNVFSSWGGSCPGFKSN